MALQKFLNTFNNSSNKNIYAIDPLNSFDVSISFTPEDSKIPGLFSDCGLDIRSFGMFIQSIQIPEFNVNSDTTADTILTSIQTHKIILSPASNTITLDLINTRVPVIENIIYPWMMELRSPAWLYESRPYSVANITVSLTSHNNVSYCFLGCRPTSADAYNPSHDLPGVPTRSMSFTFDFMYLKLEEEESMLLSMAKKLAKNLLNKGLKTIGM